MRRQIKILLIAILVPLFMGLSQVNYYVPDIAVPARINPPFMQGQASWAQSVFDTLTLEEKIGQLFIYQVYPNNPDNIKQVKEYIKKYHLGGVIFFRSRAEKIPPLVRDFQNLSPHIPMFFAIDAEWGVNMRIPGTVKFPYQMTLGAVQNNTLIYEMGHEIAHQLHLLGLNMNFAPVSDINVNPRNPVIGVRSFGEDKVNVTRKAFAYMQGLQDSGIIAFAKHFPGHGDTDKDSHKTLPQISHSYQRIYNVELYPFRSLIKGGLTGIMVAHLYVPALEDAPNTPTTLSRNVIKGLLRDSLGFRGLIVTDAMTMKGVTKYFAPGEAEIRALLAGNDIILMPSNLPVAYNAIRNAVLRGEIPMSVIDSAVMRILRAKQWIRNYSVRSADAKNILQKINSPQAEYISQKLYEQAITLVKNTDNLIPVQDLDKKRIAVISVGAPRDNTFQKYLNYYARVDEYYVSNNADYQQFMDMAKRLSGYDMVIVSVHGKNSFSPPFYGVNENAVWLTAYLANKTNVILDLFAPPYLLNMFNNIDKIKAIVISYENTKYAQQASAQVIFGGIGAQGILPVSAGGFAAGTGIFTKRIRLKYSSPVELGINPDKLRIIDTIIQTAIDSGAFPGCQILAIKDTVVFFNKAYGYFTYQKKHPVTTNTLYDIASLTKTTATTLALMRLYDQGKLDLNQTLSHYLPGTDTTNKGNIRIIDILTHQARLKSWIPFYLHTYTKDHTRLNPKIYSDHYTSKYNTQVADHLYIIGSYRDSILKQIYASRLLRRKRYLYSDLGFILMKQLIERQTDTSLDQYVKINFYDPLGAWHTVFNPLKYFPKNQIAPTENDTYFRHQIIQGYVHDYAAALMGGVSGHAGLFSNANDLAKIYQMLLQNGYYAGKRYIKSTTVKLFTTRPFPRTNRRYLGFDGKDGEKTYYVAPSAPDDSYGHTGFTGCMVWVDRQNNFIFIFLSNRVYPDIKNYKMNHMRIRARVHQAFYEAFPQQNKKEYIAQ